MKTHKLKITRYKTRAMTVLLTVGNPAKNIEVTPKNKRHEKDVRDSFEVCFGFVPAKGKTYNITVNSEVEK